MPPVEASPRTLDQSIPVSTTVAAPAGAPEAVIGRRTRAPGVAAAPTSDLSTTSMPLMSGFPSTALSPTLTMPSLVMSNWRTVPVRFFPVAATTSKSSSTSRPSRVTSNVR